MDALVGGEVKGTVSRSPDFGLALPCAQTDQPGRRISPISVRRSFTVIPLGSRAFEPATVVLWRWFLPITYSGSLKTVSPSPHFKPRRSFSAGNAFPASSPRKGAVMVVHPRSASLDYAPGLAGVA